MLSKENYQLSQKEQQRLGLPGDYKLWSPFPFGSMNQQDSRIGMQDNEFYFRENFIHIGNGNLRTLWDNGDALYTAPTGKIIVFFYPFNIGSVDYHAVFLDDGTGYQVDMSGIITTMSSVPNTFYNSSTGQFPCCSQWGSQYLLIANNNTTNDYWVWDGSVFYAPGTIGPQVIINDAGSGYSSAPTVTAFGGSGSGIVANATVANGSVVNVQITNPGSGYLPGDVVQFQFSGGGSDAGAVLTAVLTAGTVSSLTLVSGGSGYTGGPFSLGFSGGGGTGAAGTYTISGGKVTSLTLTNGGSGYTGSPTISFPSGGGTGAAAVANISGGTVSSVTINNGGTNFTTTPTLTFEGGGGTGATATAVLTAGVITSVTVTNGGSGYTSAPAILVQSGTNNAASATATLMPFGVSGTSMETFQQRVWLCFPNQTGGQENGGTILISAPESFTDFATSDGGVTYVSTDSFLRAQYTNIKQTNGYLYPIGDSSVSVISNVQTSGSPSTTTFNYQNTDPQIGTSWRDSCISYSRTILMANKLGVYGLYGGAVTKISQKMDNIFTNAVFPPSFGALTPSGAVANIFSQKVALFLMTINDPVLEIDRNVMLSWDEKEWFISSQSTSLTFIATQEIDSNLTAWGTDGKKLVPLFQNPSQSISKRFSTKLYGAQSPYIVKNSYCLYMQGQDLSPDQEGITMSVTIDSNAPNPNGPEIDPDYLLPNSLTDNGTGTISFQALPPTLPMFSIGTGGIPGVNLGWSMTSNSSDFMLVFSGLAYLDSQSVVLGSTGELTGE
jgi:hypothetical protein